MKKFKLGTTLALGSLLVGGNMVHADEKYPSENEANQKASVTLSIDESGGNVVNPEDPKPIDPIEPGEPGTNEGKGLLKINYVSDLVFQDSEGADSIEYTGDTLVLTAALDTNWKDEDGALELNPFINIEDRRVDGDEDEDGTAGQYTVTAKIDSEGFSNGTTSIKGAVVNFNTETNTYGDTAAVENVSLGAGDSQTVVSTTEAIGSHSISFKPATLTIPKNISLSAGEYTATIEWNVMGESPDSN